jgi:flagellar biosynthesis protein FlhB
MDTSKYPIEYQIACIVLTALFLWSFSIAREPRGWRRLFQSMFSKSESFSVNKNKVIDESLKRYGIFVAMTILVVDVTCFVMMVTHPLRMKQISKEEREQQLEMQKVIQGSPDPSRLPVMPK